MSASESNNSHDDYSIPELLRGLKSRRYSRSEAARLWLDALALLEDFDVKALLANSTAIERVELRARLLLDIAPYYGDLKE